jgi:DHA2 family multidrug resistance protein-like MFS transporter
MLIGAGDGVALTVASDTILTVAPKDRAGAASAVSETGYELGTALGIALLGSILTAVYQTRLRLPDGLDAAVTRAAVESPGGAYEAAPKLPDVLATELTEAAHKAFASAMTLTTLVGAAILVVGACVAWYLLPGRVDPVKELAPQS